ncbi:DUF262 domain-containing protein [Clostridium gasigenes]|uniref:DUF262 domain-containing protein n=1 Tax=Clostridium gasigenes TaxID=94869 RepID=UPI0014383C71|nr:DUF262 domain-containing protein [Clostridium gasigenes]NKF07113.1 DUF262 domain-containing protein [Clostridium gasigenes]QSW19636.1 DUF262 domain-containing protein [Clostridium gasigenes]
MSNLLSMTDFITKLNEKDVIIPMIQRNYKWESGEEERVRKETAARGRGLGEAEAREEGAQEKGKRNTAHNLAWDIKNKAEAEEKKDLILGMVVIYTKDGKEYQLLDGQQRMITLTLIMKYLSGGKEINPNDWFEFSFERDGDLELRDNYLFIESAKDYSGTSPFVDVGRMAKNYAAIEGVLRECDKEKVKNYLLNNVKIILHETKTKPLDEFLNINANKTSFSVADYMKIFLMRDIDGQREDGIIIKDELLELWNRVSELLYSYEQVKDEMNIEENAMFSLIKDGYDEVFKELDRSRLDLLFADRYTEKPIKPDASYIESKYATDTQESPLVREIEYLRYYRDVLSSIKEELAVMDDNGQMHPNANVFNSFETLKEIKKGVRFFEIFSYENVKNRDNVTNVLRDEFNLTAESYRQIRDNNDTEDQSNHIINQFFESLMKVDIKKEKKPVIFVKKDDKGFNAGQDLFDIYFKDYVEIINKGKQTPEFSIDGVISLKDLFESDYIKEIKIPRIQRDYIQGSKAEDFLRVIAERNITEFPLEKIQEDKDVINGSFLTYLQARLGVESHVAVEDLVQKAIRLVQKVDVEISPHTESIKAAFNNLSRVSHGKLINNIFDAETRNKYGRDYRSGQRQADYEGINFILEEAQKRVERVKLNPLFFSQKELKEIEGSESSEQGFVSSSVVGYIDDRGVLWVYDGQQRFTTFVCTMLFLFNVELRKVHVDPMRKIEIERMKENLGKFSFLARDNANDCLRLLLSYDGSSEIEELLRRIKKKRCDQTTQAIINLLEKVNEICVKRQYPVLLSPSYMYNFIKFEFVSIEETGDAEQLFMDLNSGMKLNESEIYKAELSAKLHKMRDNTGEFGESLRNKFDLMRHNIDNSWLDRFHGETDPEKIEMCYLKRVFEFAYMERHMDWKGQKFSGLAWLEKACQNEDFVDTVISVMKHEVIIGLADEWRNYQELIPVAENWINYEKVRRVNECEKKQVMKIEQDGVKYHLYFTEDGLDNPLNTGKITDPILKLQVAYSYYRDGHVTISPKEDSEDKAMYSCAYVAKETETTENFSMAMVQRLCIKDFYDRAIFKSEYRECGKNVSQGKTVHIKQGDSELVYKEVLSQGWDVLDSIWYKDEERSFQVELSREDFKAYMSTEFIGKVIDILIESFIITRMKDVYFFGRYDDQSVDETIIYIKTEQGALKQVYLEDGGEININNVQIKIDALLLNEIQEKLKIKNAKISQLDSADAVLVKRLLGCVDNEVGKLLRMKYCIYMDSNQTISQGFINYYRDKISDGSFTKLYGDSRLMYKVRNEQLVWQIDGEEYCFG